MAATSFLPAPAELHLVGLRLESTRLVIEATTHRPTGMCPRCGTPSRRVHSRYTRTLADLPWQGLAVQLHLHTRKFFCEQPTCARHIFTERLPETTRTSARRTERLRAVLAHLSWTAGGALGTRLAALFGVATSAPTLLRVLRELRPAAPDGPPRVVGIDDWAWRRGHTYGAIVVDLERHCVLDLLPDRSAATAAAWLAAHPTIEVISRDRSSEFAEAARRGAPQAVQVADRFHLLCNLTAAVERILGRHYHALRAQAHALTPGPAEANGSRGPAERPPTAAQQRSAASRAERLARYDEVMMLRQRGLTLEEIQGATGLGIGTIHRWIHAGGFPEQPKRRRLADSVVAYLRRRWAEGCRNASAIWRELQAQGVRITKEALQREAQLQRLPRRTHQRGPPSPRAVVPSPRRAAWLLLRDDAEGTSEERAYVAALLAAVPALAEVQRLGREFLRVIRAHDVAAFDAWLVGALASELRRFARTLHHDVAAVRAAVALAWSNGQAEGQITRLKLLKRTMYGRARFDLLRHRVLDVA